MLLFFGVLAVLLQIPQVYFFFSSKERISFDESSGAYDATASSATFLGKTFSLPEPPLVASADSHVLGDTTSSKRIEVDLTNQRLYAFEGDSKVFDFPVSTGLWGRTPTGEFEIWIKLRYTTMKGGNKALGTYYYLPNVPYTMFFYNDKYSKWVGYGIHGTYWHNNFGHPMSHGCINMRTEEVAQLYYWAHPSLGDKQSITATASNRGTKVIIYGTAPPS